MWSVCVCCSGMWVGLAFVQAVSLLWSKELCLSAALLKPQAPCQLFLCTPLSLQLAPLHLHYNTCPIRETHTRTYIHILWPLADEQPNLSFNQSWICFFPPLFWLNGWFETLWIRNGEHIHGRAYLLMNKRGATQRSQELLATLICWRNKRIIHLKIHLSFACKTSRNNVILNNSPFPFPKYLSNQGAWKAPFRLALIKVSSYYTFQLLISLSL